MSLLRNCSVRTILATVFLVLAAGLCATLGWQLYNAWDLSVKAEQTLALAKADKAVFRATYDIRQQRTDVLSAAQTPETMAGIVATAKRKAQEAMEVGQQAVAATPGIDAG